ncbi:MAG: bis(5'-nucleosyl)-tetraphosphatase (symmetrical) YqeK [Bacillota bacterium]|nr:bis(5'-nucleosyl)-tetraphosphatase (symmetrical) YqeK [Bacillota bacterium]
MDYISTDKKLRSMLSPDRYRHSKGVEELAVALALHWGADVQKAKMAGLLHDLAKNLDRDTCKRIIETMNADPLIKESCSLWHGPIGAYLLKKEFGIDDDEIYDAVYYHTIGKLGMSLLTKIIYVADAIEINRDAYFDWAPDCRKIAMENLDKAVLEVTDRTILSLIDRKLKINPTCILLHNEALLLTQK